MFGHIGEFITVFDLVIRLQGMEIIRMGLVWMIFFAGLSCTWVWLINEDKLGFSMDRDAGFFSKTQPDCPAACDEACAS